MTIRERVMNTVNSADFDIDSIDKLIAIAYYMGCEESARRVCDKASASEMTERRYRHVSRQNR